MKVIYKATILEQIEKEQIRSKMQRRVIEKVILTEDEAEELAAQTPGFPRNIVEKLRSGDRLFIRGIRIELEEEEEEDY